VLALVKQTRLEKAAREAGMSTVIAWRIRKTPEFEVEYRKARRKHVAQANAYLQRGTATAVAALLKIMIEGGIYGPLAQLEAEAVEAANGALERECQRIGFASFAELQGAPRSGRAA